MPKISVIIPVYNVEPYLHKCMDSIINQTFKDIEIICINDGSTDNSLRILEEYANKDLRIKIITQKNQGLSAARNTGLDIAKGEYITFIDSDDYADAEMLETLLHYHDSDNRADVVICNIKVWTDDDDENVNKLYENKKQYYRSVKKKQGLHKIDNVLDVAVSAYAKLYKKEIIDKYSMRYPVGLINEDNAFWWNYATKIDYYYFVDKDMYYRLVRKDSIEGERLINNKNILDIAFVAQTVYLNLLEYNLYEKYKNQFNPWFNNICNVIYNQASKKQRKKLEKKLKKIAQKCNVKLHLNGQLTLLQKIFSITNHKGKKVVCILGLKIKFKNKYKDLIMKLNEQNKELREITDKKNTKLCNQIDGQHRQFNEKIKELEQKLACRINEQNKNTVEALVKMTPQPILSYFTVHLVDECNLKCRGCDHFAPLAKGGYLSLDVFERDFKRLSELSNKEAGIIALMGGEPLLHPELLKFLPIARNYFPNSCIQIVTNGILLNQQSKEFWETCEKYDIHIINTKYPLNLDYDLMIETAKKYNVNFRHYGTTKDEKLSYHVPLDLNYKSGTNKQNPTENFMKCFHANNCIMLKNGRLYTCTVAPNIEHFNKYFGTDMKLSDNDSIDIHKAQSMKEILEFLAKPIPFCRYCDIRNRTYGHKWEVSKKDIKEWTCCK